MTARRFARIAKVAADWGFENKNPGLGVRIASEALALIAEHGDEVPAAVVDQTIYTTSQGHLADLIRAVVGSKIARNAGIL
jgi:hypothetical protein